MEPVQELAPLCGMLVKIFVAPTAEGEAVIEAILEIGSMAAGLDVRGVQVMGPTAVKALETVALQYVPSPEVVAIL